MSFYFIHKLLPDTCPNSASLGSFSLLNYSSSPFMVSTILFTIIISLIGSKAGVYYSYDVLLCSICLLLLYAGLWLVEVCLEYSLCGFGSSYWVYTMFFSVSLFIVSEVKLFSGFIVSYLCSCFLGSTLFGGVNPPFFLEVVNPFGMCLLGTCLLLSSGVSLTWFHHSSLCGDWVSGLSGGVITVLMGATFSVLQYVEFSSMTFSLSSTYFGSYFYSVTGLHGLHVLLGLILLTKSFSCLIGYLVPPSSSIMLESSILYWHFVDVVWVLVYILFYIKSW